MKTTPIIMLTAKGDENDRLRGFEAGADDYVVKPFSPRELLCRIHSVLKRTKMELSQNGRLPSDKITLSQITIEHDAHRVTVNDQPLALTLKEYELLRFFALHVGKTFTREQLFKEVWNGEICIRLRTVDTHVKRLRDKFDEVRPSLSRVIITVWGIGYRFDPTAA